MKDLQKDMASKYDTTDGRERLVTPPSKPTMPALPSVGYAVILRRILRYPAALWTPWERQWMQETLEYLKDQRNNGK